MLRLNAAWVATFFIAAGFAIAHDAFAQAHTPAPSPKVHAGEEIFTQKCMQCHAIHEGQTSFGPNLAGEMKKSKHKSAAEIRAIINGGKGKMPGFAEKLTVPEIDDLVLYLHTL